MLLDLQKHDYELKLQAENDMNLADYDTRNGRVLIVGSVVLAYRSWGLKLLTQNVI
ncbi:MAG: hypothetical protein ACK5Z2_12945 [Bacteroidota bacterium]|jgi:hypothetical protein